MHLQKLEALGIRREFGNTAKTGRAEWWRGLSKAQLALKLRIAESHPVFMRFWCRQPYVGLCEMRVFGQTVADCARRGLAYVERYHFRAESKTATIKIKWRKALSRKGK